MNVLLTGISKGLGLVTAKKLLKNSHHVFGISRSCGEELSNLKREYPNNLSLLRYDLKDSENINSQIFKEFIGKRPINAFINNAALAYDDIVTNANLNDIDTMFRINVFSPMILTKYVIRNMCLHKTSVSIVHISSISVHTGYKGLSMYAASKGALEAFSKNTAREWGANKVRSNCIVAGFMDTEMSSKLSENQKNRIYNRTSQKTPVDPTVIASTISFLISDNSKSITGQNIFVDAGTI